MVVLGFLVVAAAVVLGAGVALSTSTSAGIDGFGFVVDTTTAGAYFAGAATALVLVAGLWMMKAGTRRTYRRRREVRELRRNRVTADTPAPDEPAGTHRAAEREDVTT